MIYSCKCDNILFVSSINPLNVPDLVPDVLLDFITISKINTQVMNLGTVFFFFFFKVG